MTESPRRAVNEHLCSAFAARHAGSARDERRWSLRFGRVFGIQLYAHLTFVLLLLWIAADNVARGRGLAGALDGVGFVTAVFAIVILHELGHALTARAFGVLREIGNICKTLSRRQDAVYRYGGEELCILLHDTDRESARAVSERLVASVRHLVVPNPAWAQGCVTVSAGVAMGPAPSVTAWIERADRALYAAKDAGKNRVEMAT